MRLAREEESQGVSLGLRVVPPPGPTGTTCPLELIILSGNKEGKAVPVIMRFSRHEMECCLGCHFLSELGTFTY